jgi:hypothetical protein
MGVNRMVEIYLRRADEDVRWRPIRTDAGKRLAKGIRVNCITRLKRIATLVKGTHGFRLIPFVLFLLVFICDSASRCCSAGLDMSSRVKVSGSKTSFNGPRPLLSRL